MRLHAAHPSRPRAERAPYSHELAEMVGVVIGHDQDRAQVGLVGLAGWDRLSQIEGGVRDELPWCTTRDLGQ